MGMVIHERYYEVCRALPEEQRAPFMLALVAYGMEGVAPDPSEPWYAAFLALQDRIDCQKSKAEAGRRGGMASRAKAGREQRQGETAASCEREESDAQAYAEHTASTVEAQSDAACVSPSREEKEREEEKEEDPKTHRPPRPYAEIVGHLNAVCGTAFKEGSEKTRRLIDARLNEGWQPEHFRRVVDVKAAEWLGTDMAKYLRPETLFGTKFEGYLNQRQPQGKGARDAPGWLDEYPD